MFLRSKNPLLTFLPSYHVWVSLMIKVNFRFNRNWWFCLRNFHNFFSIRIFEIKESIAYIPTELPCSGDLENLGQLPVQEGLECNDDFVSWIFTISSVFMFSRSRNTLVTFLMSYHVRVTSKIQVNFRFNRYWWFCLIRFWNFFTVHAFEVEESIADIPTELPCSGDLRQTESPRTRGRKAVVWHGMRLAQTLSRISIFKCPVCLLVQPRKLRKTRNARNTPTSPLELTSCP